MGLGLLLVFGLLVLQKLGMFGGFSFWGHVDRFPDYEVVYFIAIGRHEDICRVLIAVTEDNEPFLLYPYPKTVDRFARYLWH